MVMKTMIGKSNDEFESRYLISCLCVIDATLRPAFNDHFLRDLLGEKIACEKELVGTPTCRC
jgi:hypothetical protein